MKLLRNLLHENAGTEPAVAHQLPFPTDATAKQPLLSHPTKELPPYYHFVKRFFDVLGASLIIVLVLSWLLPVLVLINAWVGNYPAFFIQRRIGYKNRVFSCYKLRTIPLDSGQEIGLWSTFLRNNKLDELPQFLNVLKGEMSIVGPRPHMLSDHRNFSKVLGKQYFDRLNILPGITGLAQVEGFEGRVTSLEKLQGRIRCDLTYIHQWSVLLDLKIIAKTTLILLKGLINQSR